MANGDRTKGENGREEAQLTAELGDALGEAGDGSTATQLVARCRGHVRRRCIDGGDAALPA